MNALAPTTEEVVSPLGNRDEVLTELFIQHRRKLLNFIMSRVKNMDESVDIAQQTFTEAVKAFSTFRGESNLHTWLYGIALNLVRNHLARSPRCRYKFETEDALDDFDGANVDPCDQTGSQECLERLQGYIDELPEDLRNTLLLVTVDQLSYQEAATELEIPVGTVRSRISRSRSILKAWLAKDGVVLI